MSEPPVPYVKEVIHNGSIAWAVRMNNAMEIRTISLTSDTTGSVVFFAEIGEDSPDKLLRMYGWERDSHWEHLDLGAAPTEWEPVDREAALLRWIGNPEKESGTDGQTAVYIRSPQRELRLTETVASYSDYVARLTDGRPDDWRPGQLAFNLLYFARPDLSEEIRGGDLDPYYFDKRLGPFLTWVADNWSPE